MAKDPKSEIQKLVFFLDFDGSMCPHLEVWEGMGYDPEEIYQLVKAMHRASSGVYWNTGRRLESLGGVNEKFLELSGYFIQGSLRWDAQKKISELVGPALPREIADHYTQLLANEKKLRLEVKASSLRIAPFQNANIADVTDFFERSSHPEMSEWEWHLGARGSELLHNQYNKAFAIRDVLGTPMSDDRIPVVIGDDVLDKPAVEEALARKGYAILVGEHCGWAADIEHEAWQLFQCRDSTGARQLFLSWIQ